MRPKKKASFGFKVQPCSS